MKLRFLLGPVLLCSMTSMASAQWWQDQLSQSRGYMAATTVDGLAIFAGGWHVSASDRVDIYDVGQDAWTTASLSQPRISLVWNELLCCRSQSQPPWVPPQPQRAGAGNFWSMTSEGALSISP